MSLTITSRGVEPDDPDGPFRRLSQPDATSAVPSPWVAPDYTAVADTGRLAGPGPYRDWPGPPLVMPAGLLPDGQPWGHDDRANALRIEGVPSRSEAEADACVWAYRAQQALLRKELGLPRAERVAPTYALRDTPETLAAIERVHAHERARRRRRAG